ncbi:hypothetical protein QTG54_010010 [Skeletonema marinoi]|uniref:Uncharacterized protein n=1 Tax=Skeletonema marinoi TaxID=267567 RepID=A0AAD9D9V5_9STRA|nr:hypothetical protein QTG54_010010 [Skeletonema marinoi]
MSSSITAADLTDIVAAVGPTIFSYLPVGSLLNGISSSLLVNKIFRGAILEYLQEAACLSFSQCPHLRKINDDQLIRLVQRMLGDSTCLKTKQLDLSKCRKLKGEGVIFCLKSMPNIEKLSLSSATRFHITGNNFNDPSVMAAMKHLKHMDVSGCSKLNTPEICCLSSNLSGSNIRVLDFSGCSTLIGDDAAVSVAEHCHNLESINVSGSRKLTTFGVTIIAFVCRSTLRCLSLRGCESVKLTTLLYSHAREFPVNQLLQWWYSGEDISVLRHNVMEGNNNDNSFITRDYVDVVIAALKRIVDGPVFTTEQDESERLLGLCKEYEERWTNHYGWVDRRGEQPLFGRLEKLDISDSYPIFCLSDPELAGVVAIISWFNRGKLREINLSGLSISPYAVSSLALASGSRLQCIEVSYLRVTGDFRVDQTWVSLMDEIGVSVCELDLSCCNALIDNGTNFSEMNNLRSLNLDHLLIEDYNMAVLLSSTKRLLHLSVHGCSKLEVSVLTKAKAINPHLELLDLDVRDAFMDVPLSTIRDAFPSLLKLNNRCTAMGTSRIKQHQQNYQWRVGARERNSRGSNKRKRGESLNARESRVVASASMSLNCCSLQLTGFSKAGCTVQEMFGCKTCRIEFDRFVCMTCSKACHTALGHEVFSIGYGPGYCDCCILSKCMCI